MLYTNFIKRRYTAEIFVFRNKSYLDKEQRFIGGYDISFIFVYFDKLWDELMALKKQYLGHVSAQEVTSFMLGALPNYFSYFARVVRNSILYFTDRNIHSNKSNPLDNIQKNDIFMINVGDYMTKTETVYEERKYKDSNKLADWFGKKLYKKYIYGDYSNLNFTRGTFEYSDFRYVRFQNSTLKDANLEGSSLLGADFRNSEMEGCRLDNCSIHEAVFSYAKLKNASFKNVRGKVGLAGEKVWRCPGFLPANFFRADLTKADFRRANLNGTNFRQANLTGANLSGSVFSDIDFSEAILRDTDFSEAILDNANFTGAVIENTNFTGAFLSNRRLKTK
jgi:uncharacterized protein YjbI with pentapeptide repeats